jgi:hypothetical protein
MKETREQIEAKINMRAWKDPKFKDKLMKDPHAALAEMGLNAPAYAKIHVHEETADSWHITIRKAPPNAKNMSEEELKGTSAANCACLCA